MRAALLGTSQEAVPAIDILAGSADLRAVITRPDRPRGRGRVPAPPESKVRAFELGVPVRQPATPAALDDAVAGMDLDLAVVVSYGMIVPAVTLARPRLGMVNLHFSLLPRWRGAAPVERAILAGDEVTGVSLMWMDAGLDAGPVLAGWRTSIGEDEDAGALSERLALGGAELLATNLSVLERGELEPVAQQDSMVTWAPRLVVSEARLDFHQPVEQVARAVRAFCPRPGAHTTWRGKRFKILRAWPVPGRLEPGHLQIDEDGVTVGTATGCLALRTVQPEGRKAMDALAWLRGVRGDPGRFG